jgi:nucleotide-binding universal stress UspA family protein
MQKIVYKKIILTHDGSELASLAIPHAAAVASACNAEIVLLRIIPSAQQDAAAMSIAMTPSDMGGAIPIDGTGEAAVKMAKEDKRRATQELEKIKVNLEESGVKKVTLKVVEGSPQPDIVAFAKDEHCDAIVMSTHGRSGLGRVLLGSVTDYVVRHARCPVFVVPPHTERVAKLVK